MEALKSYLQEPVAILITNCDLQFAEILPVFFIVLFLTLMGSYFTYIAMIQQPKLTAPNESILIPVYIVLSSIAVAIVYVDGDGFNGVANGALFLYGMVLIMHWCSCIYQFKYQDDNRMNKSKAVACQLLVDGFLLGCILFMLPINSLAATLMSIALLSNIYKTYRLAINK